MSLVLVVVSVSQPCDACRLFSLWVLSPVLTHITAACPLGCVECQLGGTGTPVCSACVQGYNITGSPPTCTLGAKINCGTGDFWDGTTCVK